MDLDAFLEMYGLPKDMPANTTESAAYNNIPLSSMAQTYGMTVDDMKQILQMPDDVTEDTPWGEALNKVTLGAYVGEDYLDEFKEYYGLDDDVTVDTLWGDIRQTVEEQQRKERIESEKEAKKAADTSDDDSDEADTSADNADTTAADTSSETAATAE
jgi:hypothetical protein